MSRFAGVLTYILGKPLLIISSVASILSILLLAFGSEQQAIIALCAFIVFLLAVFFQIYFFLKEALTLKYPLGYKNLSTSSRYSTNDGVNIVYEMHKYIVCKSEILNFHHHKFVWSGNRQPIITSETMEFESINRTPHGEFDDAILKFKHPLLYNDFSIVHIRMELHDPEKISGPHMDYYVTAPLQMINFNVELKHKKGRVADAMLKRKKTKTALSVEFEPIKNIPFDRQTSSYKHDIYHPEPGYTYRLEWSR